MNNLHQHWDNLFQHERWQANFDPNDTNTTNKLELDSTTFQQDWDSMLNNINEQPSEGFRPTPHEDKKSQTKTKDSSNSNSTA